MMELPDYNNAKKWLRAPLRWKLLILILILAIALLAKAASGGIVIVIAGRDLSMNYAARPEPIEASPKPPEVKGPKQPVATPEYKPISDSLRQRLETGLRDIQKRFVDSAPQVTISVTQGNQDRTNVADELGELLRSTGFQVKVRYSVIFSPDRVPIKVIFHPRYRGFVESMFKALAPLLRTTITLQQVGGRVGEEVSILIMGDPTFTSEGSVVFRNSLKLLKKLNSLEQ